MKRNREEKARVRVFNYFKLKKSEQQRLDKVVKEYKLTYKVLLRMLSYDDMAVFAVAKYHTNYNYFKLDNLVQCIQEEYSDAIKIKINIIKKPWRSNVQGSSSTSYVH